MSAKPKRLPPLLPSDARTVQTRKDGAKILKQRQQNLNKKKEK